MTTLDLPLRSPALYNPHLLSKEELLGLFSARQALLEELVQDLRSAAPGESAQHHLIVGQRGMGKTMLLRRLRYAVEDDPALQEHWLPLSFPEEQYNVAALSDFWLNCVDALTDALEGRGETNAVPELDRAVEELRTLDDEEERAKRTLEVLTRTADKLGKRLLLLVDNADLVLDRIGEEEWSLREVLSSQPAVTFVGASAAALESAYEYGKAFYDFFRIHELSGLSEEETRGLLLRYADAQENTQVREVLEKDPGRLRTLHTLTGGNPRTLVLLFNIFAQGPDGDVRADLERLLDQCTPLYKARFEALSAQAQQLVDALALHWDPVSAGELAETVRLPVNTVSAQLNRLVREGVVEKVPYEPASKTGFQIAERFFNIWYLMRASRRVRRRLIWLVEFLRMFYGQEELRERVRKHIRLGTELGQQDRVRHAEFSFALAFAMDDEDIRCVLERSGLQMLVGHSTLRSSLRDLVDFDAAEPEFKGRADYLERFESLRRALAQLAKAGHLRPALEVDRRILRAPLNLAEKERLVEDLKKADSKRMEEITNAVEAAERKLSGRIASAELQECLLAALERGDMAALDDIDGARLAEEATGHEGLIAVAAAARLEFTQDEKALRDLTMSLDKASSPYPWLVWLERNGEAATPQFLEYAISRTTFLADGHAKAKSDLAYLLATSLKRPDLAEGLYREAIALNATAAMPWGNLARVIDDQGRLAEAEECYRRALELDSNLGWAWNNLGVVLSDLGKPVEAEAAYRKALDLDQELSPWALVNLGDLLRREGRWVEAERSLRAAISAHPDSAWAWLELGLVFDDEARLSEAEDAYRRAAAGRPRLAQSWVRLASILYRKGSDEEAREAGNRALEIDPGASTRNGLAWDLFELKRDLGRAEALARGALDANGSPAICHTLACILVRRGKWNQAIAPVETFLTAWSSAASERRWRDIVTFFREAIATGKARQAAELLDEIELGERWRPLREALEALARDNRAYLRRVAPEVRKPAEAILEELTAPREGTSAPSRAQDDPDLPPPLASSRKPKKKSRAKT